MEQLQLFIDSFEQAFKSFAACYSIADSVEMQKGIDWYNANLLLLGMNNLAPVLKIDTATYDTYIWAYACGLLACANIRACSNILPLANPRLTR